MPRNGSGQYIPPDSTWSPATPSTTILSGDWNDLLSDMSLAITNSMATDGQSTFSASIPFAQGLTVDQGSLGTPSIAFIGDTNTGIYSPASDQLAVVAGGFQAFRAASTGVTLPLALSVGGAANLFGLLTVAGAFTAAANATIGTTAANTLTVNATSTFAGPVTVPDASFTNAKLANMATQTIKGRTTAGTGAPEDLTATQATAILNAFVGDSGAGGTKGQVPAPATGDAAANKVLGAGGAWVLQAIKAYGLFTGSTGATVVASGLSMSRAATGAYTVTISPAMANANYLVFVMPLAGVSAMAGAYVPSVVSKAAGSFVLNTNEDQHGTGAIPYDPTQICIAVVT